MAAVKLGDRSLSRFEEEIETALRLWKQASIAYVEHLRRHGCLATVPTHVLKGVKVLGRGESEDFIAEESLVAPSH
jgi:hypothetical protein